MAMNVPDEFIELCGYIDGLSHVKEDTVVQWVAGAVSQFDHVHPNDARTNAVRQFLDEVLSENRDGAELQKNLASNRSWFPHCRSPRAAAVIRADPRRDES